MVRLNSLTGPLRHVLALVSVLVVAGCAVSMARLTVPMELVGEATPVGLTHVRGWGDEVPAGIDRIAAQMVDQLRQSGVAASSSNANLSYLALSGGGSDGAFGAGLLVGWSAAGTRPEFTIVTGISTGALIAPFAYLGPAYDPVLRDIYTRYSTSELANPQFVNAVFGGVAVADNSKLAQLIAVYVTPAILSAVAHEHTRGRRLLIGTTNLDAQRPVIWDMGAIAASGHPSALDLFRKVLLASAAIPGVFPPVFIPVEAGGQRFEEMHVDGGTTQQVFFLPGHVNVRALDERFGLTAQHRLYIVRNSKLAPEWESVNATTFSIASRSISTLIKSQGLGDIIRIYDDAVASRIDFNLAAVPKEFDIEAREPFDRVYMTRLFELGHGLAARGYDWAKTPPRATRQR
ncbi:MAG: patatin family protein [Rhizobiales bacterium]|nr:patatin family protein [Hyphomicrobiales bacterium]